MESVMLDILYNLPDIYLFALLCFFSILLSIAAIFIVRRYIPLKVRYKDDPVIGNISALISIIYGVLAGLTALYLINNINYTNDAVQREANSVSDLYRVSSGLNSPTKEHIQKIVKQYIDVVVNKEWPLLRQNKPLGFDGDVIIDNLTHELHFYKIANMHDTILIQDMFESIRQLYDARHQRINMSSNTINPDLWVVLLIGTILTICINYLFGMNFYLHIFTMTAAALMVSSMIFLLITLDRPFQGEFVIEPTGFNSLIKYLEYKKQIENQVRT